MSSVNAVFDINGMRFVTGAVHVNINGLECGTRFVSVYEDRISGISIDDLKLIAYELYNDFYNPNIAQNNLTLAEAKELQKQLIAYLAIEFSDIK